MSEYPTRWKTDLSVDVQAQEVLAEVSPGKQCQYSKFGRYYFFKRSPEVVHDTKLYEIEAACNLLYGYLLGFEHITSYKVALEAGMRVGRISEKVDKAFDIYDYLTKNPEKYREHYIPELLFSAYLVEEADWNPQNYIFSDKRGVFVKIDHEFSCASVTGEYFKKIYIAEFKTEDEGDYILQKDIAKVPFGIKSVENLSNAKVHVYGTKVKPPFMSHAKNLQEVFIMLLRHVLGKPKLEPKSALGASYLTRIYYLFAKFACLERASIESIAAVSISRVADRALFIEWFTKRQESVRDFLTCDQDARFYLIRNEETFRAQLKDEYEKWSEGLSKAIDNAKLDPKAFQTNVSELVETLRSKNTCILI